MRAKPLHYARSRWYTHSFAWNNVIGRIQFSTFEGVETLRLAQMPVTPNPKDGKNGKTNTQPARMINECERIYIHTYTYMYFYTVHKHTRTRGALRTGKRGRPSIVNLSLWEYHIIYVYAICVRLCAYVQHNIYYLDPPPHPTDSQECANFSFPYRDQRAKNYAFSQSQKNFRRLLARLQFAETPRSSYINKTNSFAKVEYCYQNSTQYQFHFHLLP